MPHSGNWKKFLMAGKQSEKGDGEVGRSDHERLYIRFKGVEISNPLSAHRKGEKEK